MTLSLEIPIELQQQLSSAADRLGMPIEQYALEILKTSIPPTLVPTNGAELVAYWEAENLIGSRADIADTAEFSRELRERSERRVLE